jgi:hypothetical protein
MEQWHGGRYIGCTVYRLCSTLLQFKEYYWSLISETLKSYQMPGSVQVMSGYNNLQMPWTLSQPMTAFNERLFVRRVWNEGGRLEVDGTLMCGELVQTLEDAEQSIGATSAVTRWREKNAELAHTGSDCVVDAFAKVRSILGPATKTITTVGPTVL